MRAPAPARLLRPGPKSTETQSGQMIRQLRGCSGAISSPLHDLETGGGRADARASCPPAPGAPLTAFHPGGARGGVGGAGTESPWQRLARHAPRFWDQEPRPRPRLGPLSGNAKPEAWLPDLLRYSRGSRPLCSSLAKRRDTVLPLPRGPQPWCFFALSFTDEARGAPRHSLILAELCPEVPAGPRQSPALGLM